jgi:hypothetical protein
MGYADNSHSSSIVIQMHRVGMDESALTDVCFIEGMSIERRKTADLLDQ